ncbi:MAG TPA: hypothetical protein VFZ48_02935 [Candidatus Saccharimonadales bacterium]
MFGFDEAMAKGRSAFSREDFEVAAMYFSHAANIIRNSAAAEYMYGVCCALLKAHDQAQHAFYRAIGSASQWWERFVIRETMRFFALMNHDYELADALAALNGTNKQAAIPVA